MSLEVSLRHRQGGFTLDAAFEAMPGVTALFGKSGSGKTTLVNAIAGLARPERGRIVVDGTVLLDTAAGVSVPVHRRRVGYVFQEGRLFPHLTVRQNLLYGRLFAPSGRGVPADALGFDDVVALLGIAALLPRRPGRLSGGEKQRVAIGRALLSRPRLLLMDEPLAALDEARKAEILPALERLRDEAGVPIVYVSHALAEVARLAGTVVLLEDGRVVASGPTAEVLGGRPGLGALLGEEEAGTVLEARVAGHDAFGLSRLATPAGALLVPRLGLAAGARLRAVVRPRDVMLALRRPEGISALNVLHGTIAALEPAGDAAMEVRLRCGAGHLLARITRKSAVELRLAVGLELFAVIKSVAIDGGGGAAVMNGEDLPSGVDQ
jgi:molybdate transport system ATP-binding protein